jgi:hypothetical protein
MWRPLMLVFELVLVFSALPATAQKVSSTSIHLPIYGKFTGTLKLTPVGDGVHMRVVEPISYDDGLHDEWNVPAGFESDGASIPRALWSILGSPFSGGNYVEAAVVHDEGCVSHQYSWQTTHRMFYRAMIDSGVSEHQAKVLYLGVRLGGPRWHGPGTDKWEPELPPVTSDEKLARRVRKFDHELKKSEDNGNPITLEQIEDRSH